MLLPKQDKIEIEIQMQTNPDAPKYLLLLKTEENGVSKTAVVATTENKPAIIETVDSGDLVLTKEQYENKLTPDGWK
jgi:hypothetical protein